MPNMFGGDQFHPSYMPRDMGSNECEVGNRHYWIRSMNPVEVAWEDVDGSRGVVVNADEVPEKLRLCIKSLQDGK